ncbi:hypothetical protein BRADI_3g35617v3 [Brachypodium distachyon]|uniref:Uncharacterized protein n=1 Tax=Brachypodium distachyon TaxID=15368 RepID=A0A2K2D1D9_BRADI|nr:hypothetical protein BRADI_3g35617v3 [Brachypodium distachyon]
MPKLLRHRSAALSISMTSFILNSSARRNLRSTVSARSSSRTSGTPQMSSSFGSASSSDAVGTKVSSMASTVHPWAPLSWAPRSSPPFRRRPCSPAAAASRRGVFSVGVTLAGSASPCHSTASSRTTTMVSPSLLLAQQLPLSFPSNTPFESARFYTLTTIRGMPCDATCYVLLRSHLTLDTSKLLSQRFFLSVEFFSSFLCQLSTSVLLSVNSFRILCMEIAASFAVYFRGFLEVLVTLLWSYGATKTKVHMDCSDEE